MEASVLRIFLILSLTQVGLCAESPSYVGILTQAANALATGSGFTNGSFSSMLQSPELLQIADVLSKTNILQTASKLLANVSNLQPLLQSLNSNPNSADIINNNIIPLLLGQINSVTGNQALLGVSGQCVRDIGNVIFGLGRREQWALRMLDAAAKIPVELMDYNIDWIGSFDECVAITSESYGIDFRGQYCTLISPLHVPGQAAILKIGACFPDSCSSKDLTTLFNNFIGTINLPVLYAADTTCQLNDIEYSTKAIAMLILCGFFVSVMAIATLYDITIVQGQNTKNDNPLTNPSGDVNKPNIENGNMKFSTINTETTNGHTVNDIKLEDECNRTLDGHIANKDEISEISADVTLREQTEELAQIPSYTEFMSGEGKTCDVMNSKTQTVHDVKYSNTQTGHDVESKPEPRVQADTISHNVTQQAPVHTEYQPGSLGRLLLSFSVYTNGKKLLSTNQSSGTLTAVNGIRFLSMTWVILGHTYALGMGTVRNIGTLYPALIKRLSFQAIMNALVSVDSFFTLSGLLLTYLMMKGMEKTKGPKNWFTFWIMYYFHRFWRLTPPYILTLGVYVSLSPYFYNGPHYPQTGFATDKDACADTWYLNLLYVNNFVKVKDMCMAWSWYLANDMQFYVISPIMLLPLFIKPVIGVIKTIGVLVGLSILTGINAKRSQWPPSLNGGGMHQDPEMFYDYYIKPYYRMGPYIVGMLTGYVLYITKCNVKINKFINLLCWAVATTLACLVLYGLHKPFNGDPLNDSISALYLATHRTVWGACVSWVVFACATGNGGFINTLLSWKAFVPLARLTYCAYLIHPIIIYVYAYSLRTPQYWTDLTIIYLFFGHLVLSYLAAFVVSLAFESPMMAMEKVVFGGLKSKKS